MRVSLPYFLLRRIGRTRPLRRVAGGSCDPADMGTDFALEASLAGWSERARAASGETAAADAPPVTGIARHDESPLAWLGRPRARRQG
jgi:hypothetical protein